MKMQFFLGTDSSHAYEFSIRPFDHVSPSPRFLQNSIWIIFEQQAIFTWIVFI